MSNFVYYGSGVKTPKCAREDHDEDRRPTVNSSWMFLTNHAHVLFSISENSQIRARDIAAQVGITERAAQRIIAELEEAGYLSHERVGRRNHYEVAQGVPLRHALESHVSVDALLQLLHRDTDAG